jgi:hypothetical protein
MKRILISILAIVLCVSASAQGHFNTKRYKIKDFREKVTKIVVMGNDITQTTLSQEVLDRWTISAFELCTKEEFEATKTSADYYFLILTDGISRNGISSGITYLTLVKGGPEASKGIGSMTEVVSLPVCSSAASDGCELTFMGAFVEIIQEYTLQAIESEYNAYMGLTIFNKLNLGKNGSRKIVHISEDDIDPALDEAKWRKYAGQKLVFEDGADVDDIFLAGTPDALVSYVVAPARVSGSAWAYKMLIEAGTGKLFYYHKERLRPGRTHGFNELDLKNIKRLR